MKTFILSAFVLAGAASGAHAADPILTLGDIKVRDCGNDGGGFPKCPGGTEVIANGLRNAIEEDKISCAGLKPQSWKLEFDYDYNEGSVLFAHSHVAAQSELVDGAAGRHLIKTFPLTDESTLTGRDGKPLKTLPHLPACVREVLLPKIGDRILRYLDLLRSIDPSFDFSHEYVITVKAAVP